jgi:hypothetical protein
MLNLCSHVHYHDCLDFCTTAALRFYAIARQRRTCLALQIPPFNFIAEDAGISNVASNAQRFEVEYPQVMGAR